MTSELENWIRRQLTAYHQAAHAVTAVELGRDVFYTTLDDGSGFGATYAEMENGTVTDCRAERHMAMRDTLFLLAGWAVDQRLSRSSWQYQHRGGTDIEFAAQRIAVVITAKTAQHSSIAFLQHYAMSFMSRADVFFRVRYVADALLKRTTLTGMDVLRAMSRADDASGTRRVSPLLGIRKPIIDPRSPRLAIVSCSAGSPILPPRHRLAAVRPGFKVLSPESGRTALTLPARRPRTAEGKRPSFAAGFAPVVFSGEALGALRRGGITSLVALLQRTEADLLTIRAVGTGLVRQIRETLAAAGYQLPS